ncbi:MAG: putative serine/threonine-protein kinase unc-51 [Streblomastix strix]|uniref:Putative serine/threonine-protein kinase unc-51 n=1 Tax=Streblomastix strix TaxID=222440 RepID=A0A5J4VK00_9EUKA|nr:MAG: putative serine/threonine-protein kinase unc-51 [Streblomastix strix]
MEYSNSGTLFDLIKTNKNLPIPMIRVIMRQILQGLSYIHSKGLIHRDIKGGNILLHNPIGSGRVILKIADFGVAKTKTGNGVNIQVTVIGTEPYMAPEFILGDGQEKVNADAKVDIWSLGILLYKILTHEFPFKINSLVDQHQFMANAVLIRPWTIADNILWDLLQKMLQFDRNKRISAADALNHQFFTGKQAEREITIEQNQLSQIAYTALTNGDSTVTQFDTKPTFVLPLTIVNKIPNLYIGMLNKKINKFKKKYKIEKHQMKNQSREKKKKEENQTKKYQNRRKEMKNKERKILKKMKELKKKNQIIKQRNNQEKRLKKNKGRKEKKMKFQQNKKKKNQKEKQKNLRE